MEVAIGQKVLAPNPEGEGQVLATVVAFGEPEDGVEVMIEGKPVKRDVAIVQYEEGEQEGFTDRVLYCRLAPVSDQGDGPSRRAR
jgi:hypothetical protein